MDGEYSTINLISIKGMEKFYESCGFKEVPFGYNGKGMRMKIEKQIYSFKSAGKSSIKRNWNLKGSVGMKKVQIISICILIVTLVVMVVNKIVIPLPDWIIRMDGIIMLVSLFVVSFITVKCIREKS